MQIPYAVEERPDTGLNNGKLGIWLFLASEVMLFGALFTTYIYMRVLGNPVVWKDSAMELNPWLAMVNTFVLIASSVTMVMAWASLKLHSYSKYKLYMSLTFLCACGFLVIKAIEYGSKFVHHFTDPATGKVFEGIFPGTNQFFAIYYCMTGLHGVHVVGGMVVIGYLILTGKKMWQRDPERLAGRVECTGLYWHFVDLVWIFLFPVYYLLLPHVEKQ